MKVYLVTEIVSRELIANLILAATLAARGHVAIILSQEESFLLSRGSISGTTVFHAKSLHYAKERLLQHEKLRKAGFLISSIDQESVLLNKEASAVLSERFCEENLEIATRVYTWNQFETLELAKLFPEFSAKFVSLGSPRVDSWGFRFRGLGELCRKDRKRILLTPSVVMNNSLRHWDRMAIAKSVSKSGVLGGEELDRATWEYHHGFLSQIFFSKLALRLADGFPDCDVVLQPKRSEIRDSWVKSLFAFDVAGDGSRPNLFIEYSRFLEESIHGADVVVNSNSTAGLTALIGGVPLISFGPTRSIAVQLGAQVASLEEAFARVGDALLEPLEFVKTYEAENMKLLDNRIPIPDPLLAAQRIVEDLETFDSGAKSRLKGRDFFLFLHLGSFRRFVSALKSLTKLQRPVRASPDMVTKIGQARVNELLRKIALGIGIEQNLTAQVASSRNIFVTAKSQTKR